MRGGYAMLPLLLVELVGVLEVQLDDGEQVMTWNVTHDEVELYQQQRA